MGVGCSCIWRTRTSRRAVEAAQPSVAPLAPARLGRYRRGSEHPFHPSCVFYRAPNCSVKAPERPRCRTDARSACQVAARSSPLSQPAPLRRSRPRARRRPPASRPGRAASRRSARGWRTRARRPRPATSRSRTPTWLGRSRVTRRTSGNPARGPSCPTRTGRGSTSRTSTSATPTTPGSPVGAGSTSTAARATAASSCAGRTAAGRSSRR